MSLTARYKGGEFTPCPSGNHLAICYQIIDLGTTLNSFGNKTNQVYINWELSQELKVNNEPFTIGKFYSNSLNEKSNLRKDLESWRGRPFTPEELEGFDLKQIIGHNCLLNVIHNEKDGKTYANISTVSKTMKGIEIPEQFNKSLIFSFDEYSDEIFNLLPQFLREKIMNSDEFADIKEIKQEKEFIESDDVPF
jgi:hypothetical protein